MIENFDEAKELLEKGIISDIINYLKNGIFPKAKSDGFMNAYFIIQTLTDSGDELSKNLIYYHDKTIEDFISSCYDKLADEPDNLESFLKYTENIYSLIYLMNRIFSYLDRFYTKAKKPKISLGKGSLKLYYENFFKHFQDKIFKEVNKLIKIDRNGNKEHRMTIEKIMKIFRDLDLEEPIIMKEKNKIFWVGDNNTGEKEIPTIQNSWFIYFENETKLFAEEKAKKDIILTTPEYVNKQLAYLDEENQRQREFIGPKFKSRIDEINYFYLIGERTQELAQKDTGIKKMLGDQKNGQIIDQLSNLYKLFKLYENSLDEIIKEFKPYIKARGDAMRNNKELSKDPKKIIPELISLNKEMDNLINICFENKNIFKDAKNEAFKSFMKMDFYPKQLANYTDFYLRKGIKGKNGPEIRDGLDDIIGLFKYLNSKLLFKVESDRYMSDRLIKKESYSNHAETELITKLKQEAGIIFVSKMQEMINDLEKNKKETDNYKLLSHKGIPNGIKLDVMVVSQSAWEINKKFMKEIKLPKFLSAILDDFENYYIGKHQEQKLIWCLGLSKIEIQYLYLKNKNVSISTLLQLLCLLQIEKAKRITIKKISDNLGITSVELLKDINGLIFNPSFNRTGYAENGIIIKTFKPKNKEFNEDDEVSINMNVNTQKLKFNTISLPVKKTEKELKEQEEKDEIVQKKYKDNIIQATITRIMKSRIGQVTTHDWLVSETSKQIGLFVAQPPTIKISIEKLIEKNIIKRNAKRANCYDYIS